MSIDSPLEVKGCPLTTPTVGPRRDQPKRYCYPVEGPDTFTQPHDVFVVLEEDPGRAPGTIHRPTTPCTYASPIGKSGLRLYMASKSLTTQFSGKRNYTVPALPMHGSFQQALARICHERSVVRGTKKDWCLVTMET